MIRRRRRGWITRRDRGQAPGAQAGRRLLQLGLQVVQHPARAHHEGQPHEHQRHHHSQRRVGDADPQGRARPRSSRSPRRPRPADPATAVGARRAGPGRPPAGAREAVVDPRQQAAEHEVDGRRPRRGRSSTGRRPCAATGRPGSAPGDPRRAQDHGGHGEQQRGPGDTVTWDSGEPRENGVAAGVASRPRSAPHPELVEDAAAVEVGLLRLGPTAERWSIVKSAILGNPRCTCGHRLAARPVVAGRQPRPSGV